MSIPARFGRLARAYCWMEYFSFGPYLQQCRRLRILEMMPCRRAVVYGDGDGRFLSELARRRPAMQVVAIDASQEMLRRAAQRMPASAPMRLVQADALTYEAAALPEAPFDLIVSHFFLDCFDEEQLTALLAQVNAAAAEGAKWMISEFAIPDRAGARQIGVVIVSALYLAFGVLTGLKARRLPDHGRVMREKGWRLEDRRTLLQGLLVSECWRRLPFAESG
jgi:ubiquinone/menaquinone biosynthesis C-methylase UbiE